MVWLIFPTAYGFLMISPNLHDIWVMFFLNLSQELKLVLLLYFGTLSGTGGKFATVVSDTGSKFATGVNDAGGKLPLVSAILAANFSTNFASVVDTGGKFATGVNDTGGK